MKWFVKNQTQSLAIALTALRLVGFWAPESLVGRKKTIYDAYAGFSFMVLLGIFLIAQSIDLFVIWGNIPLMTATAFILFTNLAQAAKFINLAVREKKIRAIVDSADTVLRDADTHEAKSIVKNCDRQTRIQLVAFFTLTLVTITGFATSAEGANLPLRAWYPYDTTKSPAYELTYAHQVYALFVAAFLNVAKDTVVTSLLAQCHCRLQLLSLSLRTLCDDLPVTGLNQLTPHQEKSLKSRIQRCVVHHQTALEAATLMQKYFSEPTFAQFNVSLVIICVTAFQLVSQTDNMVRLVSMCTYLVNMMFQVFLYCYQGNQLSEESSEIANAAYLSPWYTMSPPRRREILFIMTRSRRIARITAGGFTTLSLASFMAIIKASYSLFTLLKQVDDTNCANKTHPPLSFSTIADVKMKLLVSNVTWSLRLSLTALRFGGFWWPKADGTWKILYNVLTAFSVVYMIGIYLIVQTAEFICVLGDVSQLSRVGFILFSNLVLGIKMYNLVIRADEIRGLVDEMDRRLRDAKGDDEIAIIKSMDKLTMWQLYVYCFASFNTVYGLAISVRKPYLPLPARYPFESTISPAYEIVYTHQVSAITLGATINMSLDTLVTTLMAQCCCRFQLLALALSKLCQGLSTTEKMMLSEEDDQIALTRLRSCIDEHREALLNASQIQNNFSLPIFFQLSISSFVICVTAYQLAFEEMVIVRLWSLISYLISMTTQVFLYCYHGNELSLQSAKISTSAYHSSWYTCSARLRRTTLMLMVRSVRVVYVKAGGLTILSLATFMGIIKASYSFFTVLQTVQE
ncbi:odorant receptor Or1 [Plodia interpunctella]|uniref:odorant receptor Or1 n=1 Tax=Plodia interpunctella TaxID=58824 RepID=UPI002367963B|nr:odorant receptor Or1-like [Plodia interpunctella]